MKKILLVFVSTLLLFSCGKTEREKIDEEKEKLRIQQEASKELLFEKQKESVDLELETQIARFINIYNDYKDDTSNMEKLAQVQALTIRVTSMKDNHNWLYGIPREDFEKLKEAIEKEYPEKNKEFNEIGVN